MVSAEKQSRNHLLKLWKHLNNFFFKGFLDGNFIPFSCGGSTVSLVTEPQARNKALANVLRDLKEKDTFLPSVVGGMNVMKSRGVFF